MNPLRKHPTRSLLLALYLTLGIHGLHATPSPRPPNILVILADDLGAHDLGCDGADLHETPRIDRLAGESVRFTQAYAPSPVCSPTRASLLTGKHPARLQMTIWSEGAIHGPTDRKLLQARSLPDLPHTEITLAKRLQDAGYLTALVGKWHLGDADHYPETHGFDLNIGGTRWGAPQTFFWPYRGQGRFEGEFRYIPHLEPGHPGEYLTDRLTTEAIHVLDQAASLKKPFFLYLAHHAPHTPMEGKTNLFLHFAAKRHRNPGLLHQNPSYAAMVKSLDESVGRVLDHLHRLGLEKNTIVVFASDNGGYLGPDRNLNLPVTTNYPLRSGKGTLYEGGLRVPLLIRWPGHAKPCACPEPVVLTDLFPTLAHAAQLHLPEGTSPDGLDLAPLLDGRETHLPRTNLFFHYPHYYHAPASTPASAVRSGDWKLVESLEDGHLELFNLRVDPGEQRNLAAAQPELAASLQTQLHTWRTGVQAAMPSPNPNY